MTDIELLIAIGGLVVIASTLIGGSIWRLASKIAELTTTVADDRASCQRTHTALDADRAARGLWIQNVEEKIDRHVSKHANGVWR